MVCKCLQDYVAKTATELSFKGGDELLLCCQIVNSHLASSARPRRGAQQLGSQTVEMQIQGNDGRKRKMLTC